MDYSFWYKIRRPWSHYPVLFSISSVAAAIISYHFIVSPYVAVPKFGRGMSQIATYSHQQFQEKTDDFFQLPIPLSEFIAELEDQGFEIRKTDQLARFFKKTIFCRREWRLIWTTDGQTVTSIKALYFTGCGI